METRKIPTGYDKLIVLTRAIENTIKQKPFDSIIPHPLH